ncbi:hypothetical protein D3C80_1611340 [compost metagenome]
MQGLQQAAVASIEQITAGTRPAADEQRQRQAGVCHHVMTALADLCREHLAAIQAVAHRIVLAGRIVARGQQQGLRALVAQGPAGEDAGRYRAGGQGGAAQGEKGSAFDHGHVLVAKQR